VKSISFRDIKPGDFFALRVNSNSYGLFFCINAVKQTSPHYCLFVAVDKLYQNVPTFEQIQNDNFFGVFSVVDAQYIENSGKELDHVWSVYPDIKPKVIAGYSIYCYRKEFKEMKTELFFLGNKDVVTNLQHHGTGGCYPGSLKNYKELFENLNILTEKRGQVKIKLKAILL